MELSTRYSPQDIEHKWYKHWEENTCFKSERDDREPFVILMPPPNVTGVLHMGHMLNITIQDILTRKARLDGKNACWVPGTDHASIATEAKVVRKLRAEGIKKSDLSREEFLKHAWEWKEEYGGIILKQLKKLGASCDWSRTAFTMDEDRSKEVVKAFIDLYNKGKLYRGLRMVNWDPEAKTVLSNEEVLYNDEQSNLYHVKYRIENSDEYLTIATTRPETILGDSAIAVHPDDERYQHLRGRNAIVPLVDRIVPIIFDDYVDMEFGTGALKVTPAHDVNDYEIGKRHDLEVIDVLNDDGTISEAGKLFVGKDRFEVRREIKDALKDVDALDKIESYMHSVGRSERTNSIVEPKLSLQWYVDMKSITEPALSAVKSKEVVFHPEKYINTYRHWMENIRDWCISRQLWWGHRIPAYYYEDEIFVAQSIEEAYEQLKLKYPNASISDLKQDEDVLDTWFSSWLWPMSVFPDPEDLKYYYPTSVLVTGWDIIFLWVARMIMAGYEWQGTFPYKDVYFTGMVRDKKRRKMSKSLGNSPDALKLIEDYGADGVRFGMLSCSPAGGDLLFDDKLVEQGRNFCNKLWNMLRLISSWEVDSEKAQPARNQLAIRWFEEYKAKLVKDLESKYNEYRLSEGLIALYSMVWNDFSGFVLEIVKPQDGKIDATSLELIKKQFADLCILLHPYMPFITEELWSNLGVSESLCMQQDYPEIKNDFKNELLDSVSLARLITTKVRDLRNKYKLDLTKPLAVVGLPSNELNKLFEQEGLVEVLMNQAKLASLELKDEKPELSMAIICGASKLYVQLGIEIDIEKELHDLETELKRQEGFVLSVEKKLSNERFVSGAPEKVVALERKKLADGKARVEQLKDSIEGLRG